MQVSDVTTGTVNVCMRSCRAVTKRVSILVRYAGVAAAPSNDGPFVVVRGASENVQYTRYILDAPAVAGAQGFDAAHDFCASKGATLLTLDDGSEFGDLFVGKRSLFP